MTQSDELPVEDVLEDLCRLVEDPAAGRWCTVLLIRDGTVHHVAAPGVPASFTSAFEGQPIGPEQGSCGAAAHTGRPVLVDDIATDPKWTAWRQLALDHGYRACWSLPVSDDAGKVVATFAAYCDASRMPTEQEYELLENAAHLVSVLTSQAQWRTQLEEVADRLVRANVELRRRDRAKDDLLSVTSHELRTPLTPMAGMLETVLDRWDGLPDRDRRALVEVAFRQASRLSHLVDDLLTMSVAAVGGLVPSTEDVDVADAVSEAVDALAGARQLVVEVPSDLAVRCDPRHLQQILVNYLSNAVKYAPDGAVTVRASRHDGDVHLEVVDEGPGVPAELGDGVFEPFRHGTAHDGREGTGLGLSVVRSLAATNGGRAWHEPATPRGACFVVALPAAEA